jgi:hypothetical protein
VSKSFIVEDVRTSEQHRSDARSSFSNFYTELNFSSRHCLRSLCMPSGQRGNTSGRCLAFQNISGFLFECRNELWQRPSGHSGKPSRRGPCYGSFQQYFGKAVAVDRTDAQSSRPDTLQYFDHNFLLK